MNKIISIVVVLIIIVGVFWYFYPSNPTVPSTPTPIATPDVTSASQDTAPVTGETENVVFNIKGKNFLFDVTELEVTEGDIVTINFESADGIHDWVLDEFGAATAQVSPGTPTSVTFVADKAGTYEYYCSVGQHRKMGMVGTFIVNPKQ